MSAELVERFLARPGLSANTRRAYASDLAGFTGWLAGEQLVLATIDGHALARYAAWLGSRRPSPAPATVARHLAAARSLIRYALGPARVPALIFPTTIPRSVPEVPSPAQVDALLVQLEGPTPIAVRNRAMFELIYSSGLRVQEACDLRLVDVDLSHRVVHVTGKGDRERVAPFGGGAAAWLDRYLTHARPQLDARSDAVFISKTGRRLSQSDLRRTVRNPHRLRHACATHMLEAGCDLRAIQRLLGHTDPSTTERYTRLDPTELRRRHARAHPRS